MQLTMGVRQWSVGGVCSGQWVSGSGQLGGYVVGSGCQAVGSRG